MIRRMFLKTLTALFGGLFATTAARAAESSPPASGRHPASRYRVNGKHRPTATYRLADEIEHKHVYRYQPEEAARLGSPWVPIDWFDMRPGNIILTIGLVGPEVEIFTVKGMPGRDPNGIPYVEIQPLSDNNLIPTIKFYPAVGDKFVPFVLEFPKRPPLS